MRRAAGAAEVSLDRLPEHLRPPETRHYLDAAELLAAEPLDIVTVATTSPGHIPLVRAAIKAGVKRVIVEKPIGNCLAESHALIELCRTSGAKLSVNMSRRWSGDYAAIKRYLANDTIGELRHISMVLGQGGLAMAGVHFLDLRRFFADDNADWAVGFLEPTTASAKWGAEFWDPAGYGVVGFKNGVRGFIDLSSDLTKRERFILLRCQYGRIEVDERARTWTVVTSTSRRITFPFKDATTPEGLLRKVVAESLGDGVCSCDAVEGTASLELVMAMHVSNSRGNCPVALPLTGDEANLTINFP